MKAALTVEPLAWAQALADRLDPPPHPYEGRPAVWVRERMDEWVTRDQTRIMSSVVDNRYTAVPSCHDVGKGLALDTPLPTPTGWTTMGEVKAGDLLLGEDGRPVRVSWVSPVRDIDCYEVTFSDGARIVCDKDHLWSTIDMKARRPPVDDWRKAWHRAKVRDVVEVRNTLRHCGQRNHRVPNAMPLDLPDAELPIDPYVLGAWLGDGTAVNASITCFDPPILAEIERRGWAVTPWKAEGDFGIAPSHKGGVPALRAAGVLGDKHIPPAYLRAGYQQRLDLLRGLMDTDGHHIGGALSEISLSNQRLAEGVAELIRSLGWPVRVSTDISKLYGVPKSRRWRMRFTADVVPFHLPRKVESWTLPERQKQRTTCRTIVSVEPVQSVPTKCLAVESESRLFLAGWDMVPTHNSWTASRITAWWLDSHPKGEAFVVTTAPTAAQVGAILWREIGRAHRKADMWGYVTGANEWKMGHPSGPSELVAYGRKPADYDATGFQGIHARFVLVILDEACGIPRLLWDAVDSLATNEHARVLAIGNPDDPSSHFHTVCKPGSGWNVVHIDALKSPRFTREEVNLHPELREYMISEGIAPTDEVIPEDLKDLLVSPTWVAERIKRWGVNSPIFQSKVRGRFPNVTTDTLISPTWLNLAAARESRPTPTAARFGADVARYGSDHSILVLRQGGHCRVVEDIPSGPITEFAGAIIKRGLEHKASFPIVCVDDVGVGGGLTDILQEQGYPVVPIIGGAAATQKLPNGKPRFFNKRAELWWNMREAFAGPSGTGEDGWLDIDPEDGDLMAQLSNVKYKINSHGQIVVESKDEMKSRGVSSPDRGDALAYALAPDVPDTTAAIQTERMVTSDILGMKW